MGDETSCETSQGLEVYGELGLVPKVGLKLSLSRKSRVDRLLESAAEHAGCDGPSFGEQVADSTERMRDVFFMAAVRAQDTDDEQYLDALGRLVAGALDPAAIDELGYVMSELVRLEPVHLRALLDFFHFGTQDAENAISGLGPADAAWANARVRTDRTVSHSLGVGRETAAHVLLRLDRDGLIELHEGPEVDGERTSIPADWGCRVLSLIFPDLKVTYDSSELRPSVPPAPSTAPMPAPAELDDSTREHRAIVELEAEIKQAERTRLGPGSALSALSGESEWIALMKRRLRSVDPDNPWARNDW